MMDNAVDTDVHWDPSHRGTSLVGDFRALYAGNEIVDMAWGRWSDPDFSSYKIHRDGKELVLIHDRNTTFHRDEKDLAKGTTYNYTIYLYNKNEEEVMNVTIEVKTGEVQGTITRDTTWKANSSPYNLSGDVTVTNGTLTIEPGVEINSQLPLQMIVQGGLGGALANLASVRFTGTYLSVNYLTGFSMTDCDFNQTSLKLHSCNGSSISNNRFNGPSTNIEINTLYGCTISGNRFVSVSTYLYAAWNCTTQENNYTGSGSGVVISDRCHHNLVTRNTFQGNGRAVDIGNSEGTAEYNTIKDNVFRDNYHHIHLYNTHGNIIDDNTLTNATAEDILLVESDMNNIMNNMVSNQIHLDRSEGNVLLNNTAYLMNLDYAEGTNLLNNTLGWGWIKNSPGCTISGNNLTNDNATSGMHLYRSDSCTLEINLVVRKGFGFYLEESSNSILTGNNASDSNGYGYYLFLSNNCELVNNTAWNNSDGIVLRGNHNTVTGNTFSDNREYGIAFSDAGVDCTVSGNTVSGNLQGGIHLYSTHHNLVENNTISSNRRWGIRSNGNGNGTVVSNNNLTGNTGNGISLENTRNMTFKGNVIDNNTEYGIYLFYTDECVIEKNKITNSQFGISLGYSNRNLIANDTMKQNEVGIYVSASSKNNTIYNNLFENTKNAEVENTTNLWNISKTPGQSIVGGPFFAGNYWSDYSGNDSNSDGIGDTPHVILSTWGNATDHLPLMRITVPVINVDTGKGFQKIQQAIDDNETVDGHTILVSDGRFFENVKVNKSLTVRAGSKPQVIGAVGTEPVFNVTARDARIEGFEIRAGGLPTSSIGIGVSGTGTNAFLENNFIIWCSVGISLSAVNVGTIRGNHITDNKGDGIRLVASFSINITQNRIEFNDGCGLNLSLFSGKNVLKENTVIGNGIDGILLQDSAKNLIQGNELCANLDYGLRMDGVGTNQNSVVGNYIGIKSDGASSHENKNGVHILNGAAGNTIGGKDTGEGNIISYNSETGILIEGKNTDSNEIIGNRIGTDKSGTSKCANNNGIIIRDNASSNTIGRNEQGKGNTISGNLQVGVSVHGVGTDNNVIAGNLIGTNSDGSGSIPNLFGIMVSSGARSNTIGENNTISGNTESGIVMQGKETRLNRIVGNNIGTNREGNEKLANNFGVFLMLGAANNTIGGQQPSEQNIITGNTKGVVISGLGTDGNEVLGNHIGPYEDTKTGIGNNVGIDIIDGPRSNIIGGNTRESANIISGNLNSGIFIEGTGTENNRVCGNLIGTNVDGTIANPNTIGIRIENGASFNRIGSIEQGKGNLISGNSQMGISIGGSLEFTRKNVVAGNNIGTTFDGTAALGNQCGILLSMGAQYNIIGFGNTISGNAKDGILIESAAVYNEVKGNHIGTNKMGTDAVPNGEHGIQLDGTALSNIIGGGEKGDGNIISGNRVGIALGTDWASGPSPMWNKIWGNFIGTDRDGEKAIRNLGDGISIMKGIENEIGASGGMRTPGDANPKGNLISGNGNYGIYLGGYDAKKNVMTGNYIGMNRLGMKAIPNGEDGIIMTLGANSNIIGSPAILESGNLISGNAKSGIRIHGAWGNRVMGNIIGLDASGTGAVPNTHGVLITPLTIYTFGTVNNIIGGDSATERNIIAGNTQEGVLLGATSQSLFGNMVIGNHIGVGASWTVKLGNDIGIKLIDCRGTVVKNNIIMHNCKGIVELNPSLSFGNSGNHIINNTVLFNTCSFCGIHLDNSNSTIMGNTLSGEAGDGIFCTNGSAPLIGYNTIYNNSGYDINNTDSNVTIDARYNYWGPGGGAGRVGGKVDTSSPLSSGEVVVDMAELNGTNVSGFFDDELIIGYSVSAPVIIIVIRLQDSPVGELEDYIGDYYVIMVNDTSKVNEMNITSCYLDVDWYADPASVPEFMWWTGSEWKACSDAEQNLTLSGDFSIRCVWIRVGEGTIPAQGNLAELLIGIAAVSDGEDDEEEDNHQGLALLLVIIVVVLFVLLVLVVREKITLGERPDTRNNGERE